MKKIITLLVLICMTHVSQAMPQIQKWQTKKGASVYFVETHNIPMVDVQITFNAAGSKDGKKYGIAKLTNALLDTAAAGYDAQQIATELENIGAILSNDSLKDMAIIKLRTLSYEKQLQKSITILSQVIGLPDFKEKEVNRLKKQFLLLLKNKKQQADEISSDALYEAIYKNHPYGKSPYGTNTSINNISRADIIEFYKKYYVVKNMSIAIIGDLTKKQAIKIANKIDNGLQEGVKVANLIKPQKIKKSTKNYIKFDGKQSHILLGQLSIKRGHKDYWALYLANHILGGSGFSSIITQEVREKRGLSYSAHSYISPMQETGVWVFGLQTKTQNSKKALDVLQNTINKFHQQGITSSQLKKAKSNMINSAPLRADSNKKILGYLAMIGFYDLPLDYLNTINKNIKNIKLKQINKVIKKYLQPDNLQYVVVGTQDIFAKK